MQGNHSPIEVQPTHSQNAIRTSTAMSKKRHSSTAQRVQLHHHATEHTNPNHTNSSPYQQNVVGQGVMGFSAGGSRNNFNYWNSV